MTMGLINLKALKDDMAQKKWTVCSFLFIYKGVEYVVLVKRFVGTEQRTSPYALVKLHFMKTENLKDELLVEANAAKLLIDAKTLRTYFEIEFAHNLGDILEQFTERLGKAIPKTVPKVYSNLEKRAMVNSLSESDGESPNKIYCNKVRRNSNEGQRSLYNSDKTKLLRPDLFQHFINEPRVSFCYYENPKMENDDATILKNFSSRV